MLLGENMMKGKRKQKKETNGEKEEKINKGRINTKSSTKWKL